MRLAFVCLYVLVGLGSASRVFKDTDDVGYAWVAFFGWPAAIGYQLSANGPRTPSTPDTLGDAQT